MTPGTGFCTGPPGLLYVRPLRGRGSVAWTGKFFWRKTGPVLGFCIGAPLLEYVLPRSKGCNGSLARSAWTAGTNLGPTLGFRRGAPGLELTAPLENV